MRTARQVLRAIKDVRVLNNGTLFSFGFQKFSRWYKPQYGVSRFLIYGEYGSDIMIEAV